MSGWPELGEVARAARLAGGKVLPEMRKGLNKMGPPAKKAVQESALAKLPKSGGFAATMHRAIRMRVKSDLGLSTAGVTLVTTAAGRGRLRHIGAINSGRLRHPVYGHRTRWVTQRVPEGFWDDAMDKTSDVAHQRMREVLDATTRTLKG
ncbi:hypothetical protein O7626_00165 [Micromonospora sp. WMMD1102]|uniref:hypothetical protein n=1 Tax=Micromonospora sp. WMMD1102 TaxID=3016105 RepID=UPI0024154E0F|nr:hypothetical protein [Micromonospora sp. WMMD1102]MDG4784359.1 hypothetical protein [Micromonospora sp. WMMD1102]